MQNTFSDRTRCIAQLRPGSSFLRSALQFLDRQWFADLNVKRPHLGGSWSVLDIEGNKAYKKALGLNLKNMKVLSRSFGGMSARFSSGSAGNVMAPLLIEQDGDDVTIDGVTFSVGEDFEMALPELPSDDPKRVGPAAAYWNDDGALVIEIRKLSVGEVRITRFIDEDTGELVEEALHIPTQTTRRKTYEKMEGSDGGGDGGEGKGSHK